MRVVWPSYPCLPNRGNRNGEFSLRHLPLRSGPDLHLDLANGVEAAVRDIHPGRDVSVGSTRNTLDINIAGGVVVASYLAAVIYSGSVLALLVVSLVRERHARKVGSQYGA